MNRIRHTVLLTLAGLIVAPVFAQSTDTPRIDRREARQQQRIANGIQSGQLTAQESAHLEKREAKVVADEQAAKSDGVVTRQERAKLTREENRADAKIYEKKHNGRRTQPAQ